MLVDFRREVIVKKYIMPTLLSVEQSKLLYTTGEKGIKLRNIGTSAQQLIKKILVMPPSNIDRPFQRLFQIVIELSKKVPVDLGLVIKKRITRSIKQIDDNGERKILLSDVFLVNDKTYRGKTVLLFDDLYRSGETLQGVAKVVKEAGDAGDINVSTITKTITK